MQNIELYIVLLALSLVLSAFFSGSETVFVSLQRFRVEHLVSTGIKGASQVAQIISRPERFLSTVLLGNTLVNALASSLSTAIAIDIGLKAGLSQSKCILIATIALTLFLLIFCEVTPKTIAAQYAEKMSLTLQAPLRGITWLLTPFVIILSWIGSAVTRLLGGTLVPRSIVSDEEIRTMISVGRHEGTVEDGEAELLDKVFDFGDRPVYEVMIPRTDVIALQQDATMADFMKTYAEEPRSRYLIYRENMDDVVGVVSVKDVLMGRAKGTLTNESTISDLVRSPYFAPDTKPINELFFEMRDNGFRVAVVVDEYGGTAGIVTLSSLVEEIVGEVGDELASVEKDYEVINEYTYQIDGGMRVDEANEEMQLDLPEGEDYETVAGFILSLLGHIPRRHEQLRYKGLKIVITEMKGRKIETILVTREAQRRADINGEKP